MNKSRSGSRRRRRHSRQFATSICPQGCESEGRGAQQTSKQKTACVAGRTRAAPPRARTRCGHARKRGMEARAGCAWRRNRTKRSTLSAIQAWFGSIGGGNGPNPFRLRRAAAPSANRDWPGPPSNGFVDQGASILTSGL